MDLPRAAVAASLATVTLWTLKAVVEATSADPNGRLASVVFLVGLVACLTAGAFVGLALLARRSAAARLVGVLGTVAGCALLGAAVQAVVLSVEPAHPAWWWGELNLWAIVLALLVTALLLRRRESRPSAGTAGVLA